MNLAGESHDDRRLWNTYLFWARSGLAPGSQSLDIDEPSNRLARDEATNLQAIVTTAFAIEYRLKRVADARCISFRKLDGLGSILKSFKVRIESTRRMDTGQPVRLPDEWAAVEVQLKELNRFRNDIAHANYAQLRRRIDQQDLAGTAKGYFDAVVDAIRIINCAIGYDVRGDRDAKTHYDQLKCP